MTVSGARSGVRKRVRRPNERTVVGEFGGVLLQEEREREVFLLYWGAGGGWGDVRAEVFRIMMGFRDEGVCRRRYSGMVQGWPDQARDAVDRTGATFFVSSPLWHKRTEQLTTSNRSCGEKL